MQKGFLLVIYLICSITLFSQVTIKGNVTDEKDNSSMMGVNVKVKGTANGMATDDEGNFEISTNVGLVQIEATYVGYQTRVIDVITTKDGEIKVLNIKMTDHTKEMDIVVVSGTKTEKKFGEESTSMEVLKGQNITQSNQSLGEAVNKVPGVNMLGRTISIRGGSGFADAASNRVLFLMNETPLLSPENGSIRWDMLPIEAIDQMEITKGAASALYGSSATSGMINMRTINPQKDEVISKIYGNYGLYAPFQNKQWTWFWKPYRKNVPPMFWNFSYVWARKFNDLSVVYNGGYKQNQGFTAYNKDLQVRNYVKLKYTPHQVEGLTTGADINIFFQKFDDFFIYKDYNDTFFKVNYVPGTDTDVLSINYRTADSLLLFPDDSAYSTTISFFVNPFVSYYDKHDNKHHLKMSAFVVSSNSTTGDSGISQKYYADYSFTRKFKKLDLEMAAGLCGSYKKVNSLTFGNRKATNAAFYFNMEKKVAKVLTLSFGFRLEYNKLDNAQPKNEMSFLNTLAGRDTAHLIYSPVKPVFRLGMNWQATEGTFIRASFGQGYRFPDIAEQFVFTPRNGALAVPNPNLKPESSWSTEIGIKQGIKISRWIFFADIAAYYSKYKDQIEFIRINKADIPVPIPPKWEKLSYLAVQAQNISNTQIWGIETSFLGTGKIYGVPLNFLIGYNYMNPQNLNPVASDPTSKYLNYRIMHSFKGDIQTEYKGFILGASAIVLSKILRLDPQIGTLVKIRSWYDQHPGMNFVIDARFGYNWKSKLSTTLIVKNLTNRAYVLRPGFVEAPLNVTLQLAYNIGKVFPLAKKQKEIID